VSTPAPAADPPAAGPAGSASSAATDPGLPPTNLPPSPSPGAPTADANNLLTIVVPADATTLQMGASASGPDLAVAAISGFRVSTAVHAHVTAQTPATTISLGAPGGMGMGGVAGLSVYSAGQKDEHVVLAAAHLYDDTLSFTSKGRTEKVVSGGWTEDVTGLYDQTLHSGLKQEIDAPGYTQTISPQWTTTVEGPWTYKSDSVAWTVKEDVKWTITGDVNVECNKWECTQKGEVMWQTVGDLFHTNIANKSENTFGLTREFMIGIKSEILLGGSSDVCIGAKAEITLAAQYEMNAGPKGEFKTTKMVMEELKAEERKLALEECEASIKKIEADVHKHDVEIHLISAIILQ
jgi:hypothetical protein